ncbi:MAG: hypothetical protein AAGE52_12065 [Myxococcota bacterium]
MLRLLAGRVRFLRTGDERVWENQLAALRQVARKVHYPQLTLVLQALAPHELLVLNVSDRTMRHRGEVIDCTRRGVVWRLLSVLARQAMEDPGVFLPREVLIERVWPNERLLEKAARNRLHVAVAQARRLLGDGAIAHENGGYCLTISARFQEAPLNPN